MTDNFFPTGGDTIPDISNYLSKIPQGDTTIRIMGKSIVGYQYFDKDNVPHTSKEPFDDTPGIKVDGRVNYFWKFPVYHYEAKKMKIMTISQKTIMTPLKALFDNPKWGNPIDKFDVVISRKGTTKNDTEYAVMPNPAQESSEEVKNAFMGFKYDLEKIYSNEDPFI